MAAGAHTGVEASGEVHCVVRRCWLELGILINRRGQRVGGDGGDILRVVAHGRGNGRARVGDLDHSHGHRRVSAVGWSSGEEPRVRE